MAGKHFGGGGYEAELNRIRALEDWRIPKAAALQNALSSLDRALGTVLQSKAWTGSAAESAKGALTKLQGDFRRIDAHVGHIVKIIEVANTVRRVVASTELPSAQVDPFWANAAKGASVVIHPVLGPLAADKALDAISGFLSESREAEAKKIVESVEEALQTPARQLYASSVELDSVDFDEGHRVPDTSVKEPEQGGPIRQPRITYPDGGSTPSGWRPSSPNYPSPNNPGGGGGWEPGGDGTNPGGNNPSGGGSNPGGGSGGGNGDDPSVDSPGGGLLPGGPGGGGTGPGYPTYPGGGTGPGGGSLPGGMTPGGGGLGGAIGGGAGAAAIAASSKIAGFGSMGGLGGAGSAAGAGMRSGGGLLGNTPLGGTAGAGGAGAGGGSGAGSSGAAGAGARPGMGMMGGAGGGDDEKSKRNGLGGPIAPKIEDEDEAGPRSKGARAGSRDDHRKD